MPSASPRLHSLSSPVARLGCYEIIPRRSDVLMQPVSKQRMTRCGCIMRAERATETEQAVGRLVGALCAITARDDDAESAMLASWISQVPRHHSSAPVPSYPIIAFPEISKTSCLEMIDWYMQPCLCT